MDPTMEIHFTAVNITPLFYDVGDIHAETDSVNEHTQKYQGN
jgi:hypothetical protein